MKNSIGSLAALAAFAAPALAVPTPPQAASFSHVPVSFSDETTHINFDIDGDGTNDFYVYGNHGGGIFVGLLNGTMHSGEGTLSYGDSFSPSSASFDWEPILFSGDHAYIAFSFAVGGLPHASWVLFDLDAGSPEVAGGGWQPFANASIVVGQPEIAAVPEPSSLAALAGVAALGGALLQRRRRPESSANESA